LQPCGCFVVNGTAECGNPGTPAAVEEALRKAGGGTTQRLLKRLQRAEREGQLPPGTDAKRLANLFNAVLTGMAVMVKGGAHKARLDEVVEAALMVWPAPASKRRAKAADKAGVRAR
jgi:hypothetical protein